MTRDDVIALAEHLRRMVPSARALDLGCIDVATVREVADALGARLSVQVAHHNEPPTAHAALHADIELSDGSRLRVRAMEYPSRLATEEEIARTVDDAHPHEVTYRIGTVAA